MAEERFDRITRLACRLFDVPMALINLVDADRQWFKSQSGAEAAQFEGRVSFCSHAIRNDELFIVQDACLDTRFQDNPLVTGEPKIRFYAGCPLRGPSGHRIGTLCILDKRPREIPEDDRAILRDLAATVERQLRTTACRTPMG